MPSSANCTSPTDQMCAASGGTPVALCQGGQWSACVCMNPGAATSAATAAPGTTTGTTPSQCGNGIAEADEQCDGNDLKNMTCATLGMGSASAMLKCNTRCMFDTLMCFTGTAASATGGTGAAQGGTGARAMAAGTAGSGGTGR